MLIGTLDRTQKGTDCTSRKNGFHEGTCLGFLAAPSGRVVTCEARVNLCVLIHVGQTMYQVLQSCVIDCFYINRVNLY